MNGELMERRMAQLEARQVDFENKILIRLDELVTIKNQIEGAIALAKFIGWGGLLGLGAVVARIVVKGF